MITGTQEAISDIWTENMAAVIVKLIPMGKEPNRIRELRMARGMSQEELAGLVGCSKMQISGLERGKPRLDVLWMQRLAAPMGVAPADLLLAADNPHATQTVAEKELLALYRAAPEEMRSQFLRVGQALAGFQHQGKDAA
jgi:transcriptional regulator with XRE-family HTH domain